MKSVLFIFGGKSNEHDISCKSIINIINNLDKEHYKYKCIKIDKHGEWYKCHKKYFSGKQKTKKIKNIIKYIRKFDIVFPIIHGSNGEDGRLQGMLELFNIKYVGCKTLASAIGMNKYASKLYFDSIGILQVPYVKYNNNLKEIMELGFPLIVKPCNGGSSIGISKSNNKEELIDGINNALLFDKNIIVEKFIKSREFECSILEDNELIISEVGEIKYNNEFYDFEDKYINEVKLDIPAKIDKKLTYQIKKISKKIYNAIDGKSMCRIDFLYDTSNKKLYFNEINTIPGFTNISMFPLLMLNKGYSYQELISTLIEKASVN